MSAFHNSPDGEKVALKAHESAAVLSVVGAVATLACFGLLCAGALWHWKGAQDHRENLKVLDAK